MTDTLSKEERSRLMSSVRQKNTTPEIIVRSWLHKNGFRFRVCRRDLPGSPDIVLPKYHTVVFIHGCFWHRHMNCKYSTSPKTNQTYWLEKFAANVERDKIKARALKKLHWNVVVIWECEVKSGKFKKKLYNQLSRAET